MIPGPGPTRATSQPSRRGGVERAGDRDRLVLAAVGGRRGDVAAEQPALAQLGDVAAERPRQRPSPGLHVADLRRRRSPCASAQAAGARCPCSGRTRTAGDAAPFSSIPRVSRRAIGVVGRTGASTGSTGCWIEV